MYEWKIPNELTHSGKVKVSDALDGDLVDESDATFMIINNSLRFTDITIDAGTSGPINLEKTGGHASVFTDIDSDDFPDLYITMLGEQTMADLFFYNNGDNTFSEEAIERGIADFDSGSHGACFADLDNDGDFDLINATTYGTGNVSAKNNIYQNDSFGYFTEITNQTGIPERNWPTRAVLAFDMDKDGDLDIFGVTNHRGSDDPLGERNEIYRNDGSMKFTAINHGDLYTAPAGQGATDTDYDGDGDIDIFAANRTGDVNILNNDGIGNFTRISPASIGIQHQGRDGITIGDINNDGSLDVLLMDSEGSGYIYLNDGNGSFHHSTTFSNVPGYMGGLADLDNDGDLDLVFAGDQVCYLNDGSGNFSVGPSIPIHGASDPRAIAFADIDNDGDLDFNVSCKRSGNYLIRNDLETGNWLKIKLYSPLGQIGAFGSKIYIYPAGQNNLLAMRETRSNDGYLGQNDPVIHIGLGDISYINVKVVFLYGTIKTVNNVSANQMITIGNEPQDKNLRIITPNGGENLIMGTQYLIEWASSGLIDSVKLAFSSNNGMNWEVIKESTDNHGRFEWLIPSEVSNSCLIKVSDASDSEASDKSDGVFSIFEQSGNMDIAINCDDEYELWVNGDYIGSDDRWDVAQRYTAPHRSGKNVLAIYGVNTGGPGALIVEVKVDGEVKLLTDGNWCRSSDAKTGWTDIGFDDSGWLNVVSHGQYGVDPWKRNITGFPDDSQTEWIWSEDTEDDQRSWYFRGSFENGPSAPSPEITSFSPDSGVVGTEVTVLGSNFTDVSAVRFHDVDAISYVVDSETQLRAVVPEGCTTGQIRVTASGGTVVSEEEFVVIVGSSLAITAPNGGENWVQGSVQTIKWIWEGEIDSVNLAYSCDNGANWKSIVTSTENDGIYEWNIPNVSSDNCLVRILDSYEGESMDISDGVFVIREQTDEMEIVINSDDHYQLWVNGNFVAENDQWNVAQTYLVPVNSGKNVLTVYGRNRGSGAHGVIAEVKIDGEIVLVTNDTWRQSEIEFPGWKAADFDDSDWQSPINFGVYGVRPWEKTIQGFPNESNAHWIWGENIRDTYLRGSFQYHQLAKSENQEQQTTENDQSTSSSIPEKYALENNFPNPFHSLTSISYQIPETQFVSIKIFDIEGREIKTLVQKSLSPGIYSITWDGTDKGGNRVVSGMYFYQMSSGSWSMTKKLLLIR